MSCNNQKPDNNCNPCTSNGSSYLIIIVLYILLVIILGSYLF